MVVEEDRDDQGLFPRVSAEDARAVFRVYLLIEISRIAQLAIRMLAYLGLGYIAFLAIQSLAGRDTSVLASVSFLRANHGLPWLLWLAATIWAIVEYRLRKKAERVSGHQSRRANAPLDKQRSMNTLD